jgi:mono/diheme cytochrome c family protein
MRWNYIIWTVAGLIPLHAGAAGYRRQIAPIFAFHCNGCHGDNGVAGQFDTRSWTSLRKGGELGNDVVPGDPDASAIVQYIEGQRGEQHRMPLGSRPLSSGQIALIRAWIGSGALDDNSEAPVFRLTAPGVAWDGAAALRISCLVPVKAYLTLRLRAVQGRQTLHEQGASVKEPRERMDAAVPGSWVRWELRRERDWPDRVDVELEIRYTARKPLGLRLLVDDDRGRRRAERELSGTD